MKHLYFATGSESKFREMESALKKWVPWVNLRRLDIEIPEIQSVSSDEVLSEKVRFVRNATSLPFIVDDVSCTVSGMNGFPGPLVKSSVELLGLDGFKRVAPDGVGVEVMSRIALSYGPENEVFVGSVKGVVDWSEVDSGTKLSLSSLVWIPEQCSFLTSTSRTHRTSAALKLADRLLELRESSANEVMETASRWSERSSTWGDVIADGTSYVNHEDGYERFNRQLRVVMEESGDGAVCLDVGCGTGDVAAIMNESGAKNVLGIDVSVGMIDQARGRRLPKTVSFEVRSIDGVASTSFDVIASRGVVLSHLPKHQVHDFLIEIDRLSKPGTFAVFDFIQDLNNGGFANAGNKNVFLFGQVATVMRELGWAPVARDGDGGARVCVAAFHKSFSDSEYFVTGNPQKLLELRHVAELPHLHGCRLDLPEIKHDEIEVIAKDKARKAYEIVGRPVICTDGGIFLDELDGYPGANSKSASVKLGLEGLLRLLGGGKRTGQRMNSIVRFDGKDFSSAMASVPVMVPEAPRKLHESYPMDSILIPASPGNVDELTYAEMPPDERVKHTELPQLVEFLRSRV